MSSQADTEIAIDPDIKSKVPPLTQEEIAAALDRAMRSYRLRAEPPITNEAFVAAIDRAKKLEVQRQIQRWEEDDRDWESFAGIGERLRFNR